MHCCIIRIELECLTVAGHGLLKLPQLLERIAKVIVRHRVIRLDGERLSVARDGFI